MNVPKVILALTVIVLALVGVVYTGYLQSTLDRWHSFGEGDELAAVADGIYQLVIILYVFCAVLLLVGLYILIHK